MKFTLENPADAPAPAGPYSQVARVEVGDGALLFVSGQVAVDENGEVVAPGDMAAQSEHILGTLKALLAAYGATFDDIVNIRTFLTDMSRLREYADVRLSHITTTKPTSTTVEVSRLFKPGAMLEVEIVAAVPGAR